MKRKRAAGVLGFVALVTALAASVTLVFLPFYRGVSLNPITQEAIKTSATLIQMNGYGVLIPLAVPVILTAAGFLWLIRPEMSRMKWLVWVPTVILIIFVFITGFSIGLFYLPTAVLMLVAAILNQLEKQVARR